MYYISILYTKIGSPPEKNNNFHPREGNIAPLKIHDLLEQILLLRGLEHLSKLFNSFSLM